MWRACLASCERKIRVPGLVRSFRSKPAVRWAPSCEFQPRTRAAGSNAAASAKADRVEPLERWTRDGDATAADAAADEEQRLLREEERKKAKPKGGKKDKKEDVIPAEDEPAVISHGQNYKAAKLRQQGKLDEAEELLRKSLESRRKELGPEDDFTVAAQHDLAKTLSAKGKHKDAAEHFKKVAEVIEKNNADNPQGPKAKSLSTRIRLASALYEESKADIDESILLFRGLVKDCVARYGDEHQSTELCREKLAELLFMKGEKADEKSDELEVFNWASMTLKSIRRSGRG